MKVKYKEYIEGNVKVIEIIDVDDLTLKPYMVGRRIMYPANSERTSEEIIKDFVTRIKATLEAEKNAVEKEAEIDV